nr:uncharacterized mitochondrial protein AtMg00810-like [Tanacetum cinerariifolium]
MSTQQDIYAAGSENRPPMLNKEKYVPWSSRLLWYAKSIPNGKLIHNSIINGPYVRWMILEPAIQTILLGLPEDIYAAVDSCETAQEIWLRVQQMMKGSDIIIQEKKAKLFNEWERLTSTDGESIESYYHRFLKLMNDLKRNKYFPEKIASNLKFLNNLQLEWIRHVTIIHQTKDLHTADYTQLYDFLKYNQKEVDDLRAERLAKSQDPLAFMATSNNPYTFLVLQQDQPSLIQNVRNHVVHNAVHNPGVQNVGNQNGLTVVSGIANQNPIGNDNLVAARAGGNASGHNVTSDIDEIEEVNEKCILMANLQQASTSGTQTDKAPVYDSDGSAEDWYKKCEECKYEKISYDKAYNDMKLKIERLRAQLRDLKGQSLNTQCTSDTLDPLSQKLDGENVSLEFQQQDDQALLQAEIVAKNGNNAMFDSNLFVSPFALPSTNSAESSSQPDIVHATCLCAKYQDHHPTEKHLKEVTRIFHYLWGTVNIGLWYMKDSGFELIAFSGADHAGCQDSFKSTSDGTQFLGEKLASWFSKKQDYKALSTAKAEYVSLSTCSQVL